MKTSALILIVLLSTAVSAQAQKPTTGYAPVNGLKMYYEVHGSGEPVVLLHGAFMTITNNWTGWIGEFAKTRKVIAVEMQGHGRTADIERDISSENLADDVAALLDHLKIPKRVLKAETVAMMTKNQLGKIRVIQGNSLMGYGFGVLSEEDKKSQNDPAGVGTFAWGGAYGTFFWVDPRNELVAVLMAEVIPQDFALVAEFKKAVYAAMAVEK